MGTSASSRRKALAKDEVSAKSKTKVDSLLTARAELDTDVLYLATAYPAASGGKLGKGKAQVAVNRYRVYVIRRTWQLKAKVVWSVPVVHIARIDLTVQDAPKDMGAYIVRLSLADGSTQDLLVPEPAAFAQAVQTAHFMASFGIPGTFVTPPELLSAEPILAMGAPLIEETPLIALFRIYANIASSNGLLAQRVIQAGIPPVSTRDAAVALTLLTLDPLAPLSTGPAWTPRANEVAQVLTSLALAAMYDTSVHQLSVKNLDHAFTAANPAFCEALAELLCRNVSIETLQLAQLKCEPEIWAGLAEALLRNPRPSFGVRFELDGCNVDPTKGLALALQRAFLFASPVGLRLLWDRHQQAKPEVSANVDAGWLFAVFNGDYLPTLDASRALPLPFLGMLQDLDLTGSSIPISSFEAANASLAGCTSLRKLVLSGALEELARQGLVEDLFKALPESPLTTLDVSENPNLFVEGSGSRVAEAIANFVAARLSTLVTIALEATGLSGDQLVTISSALVHGDEDALAMRRKKFATTRRLVPAIEWTPALTAQDLIALRVGPNENLFHAFQEQSMPSLPLGCYLEAMGLTWTREAQLGALMSISTAARAAIKLDLDENHPLFGLTIRATDYPHLQAAPRMNYVLWREKLPMKILIKFDEWSRSDMATVYKDDEQELHLSRVAADLIALNEHIWSLSLRNWRLGPMASAFFEEGLAPNQTLLYLDITGNRIGDRGAEALGRALRKNRTLVSLSMDDNHVGFDGWKAIRGALYGNRKLANFPYPQMDATRCFGKLSFFIVQGEDIYWLGKRDIKHTYNLPALKWKSVEMIKYGKQLQRVGHAQMKKITEILQTILTCVAENATGWKQKYAPKQDAQRSKVEDRVISKVARQQTKILAKMGSLVAKSAKKSPGARRTDPYGANYNYYDYYRGSDAGLDDGFLDATNEGDQVDGGHLRSLGLTAFAPTRFRRGRRRRATSDDEEDDSQRRHNAPNNQNHQADKYGGSGFSTAEAGIAAILALGAAAFWIDNLNLLQEHAALLDPSVQAQMAELIDQGRGASELLQENAATWGDGAAAEALGALDDAVVGPDLGDADLDGFTDDDAGMDDDLDEGMDDVDMYAGAGPDRRNGDFRAPPRAPRLRSGARGPLLHAVDGIDFPLEAPACAAARDLLKLRADYACWVEKIEADRKAIDERVRQERERSKVREFLEKGKFWTTPASYRTLPVRTPGEQKCSPARDWCVLCTQLSADRWPRFERLARSWNGALSAAVYAPDGAHVPELAAQLRASCDALEVERPRLRLHVVLVTPDTPQSWYPINTLRNVALLEARSTFAPVATHVFLLDVDFMVDHTLADRLRDDEDLASHIQSASDTAFVVPALESANEPLPEGPYACLDTAKARAMLADDRAVGFHLDAFPKGHAPTDFARWAGPGEHHLHASYEVPYEDCFEPYVIARIQDVPLYDERFAGYGMNKISHLYALAQRVSGFRVLMDHCVMADPHARSDDWSRTSSSADRLLYLKALYYSFKQRKAREIITSATTAARAARLPAFPRRVASEGRGDPATLRAGLASPRATPRSAWPAARVDEILNR